MAMANKTEVMSADRLEVYIHKAAKAADYEEGFGVRGCDLSKNSWYVAYTRQSTTEQAENDRTSEYLFTCAKLAKQYGVVVPFEYVIYDANSSENMNRPGMIRLRTSLVANRRISGIIFPLQGRLSADTLHQLTFERECGFYGVQVIYGDAPAGQDWSSRTARIVQAQANELRIQCNRDNARAGNIARVLSNKVPAHKAPYGYTYHADKSIEPRTGRAKVHAAWWEVNELNPDGELAEHSPAWAVRQMFHWIGDQGRTSYWVAAKLNKLGISPPQRDSWSPKTVIKVVERKCYTGKGEYNANERVPNPNRPIGDLTLGVKRTLSRPRPDSERVKFDVLPLITEEQWQRANGTLRERGRGRGKQGRKIPALLRGRMLCPRCGKPMAVMQKSKGDQVYYYCRAHHCPWIENPCQYKRCITGTWDDEIWEEICALLNTDNWLDQQISQELSQNVNLEKLIRLERVKISQTKARVARVHDGWEKDIYTQDEAKLRIDTLRQGIQKAESEISRLTAQLNDGKYSNPDIDKIRKELDSIRNRNLEQASFEDKCELVARLGLKILPSEDLKTRKIRCQLNLAGITDETDAGLTKVMYGGAGGTIGRTFSLTFNLEL